MMVTCPDRDDQNAARVRCSLLTTSMYEGAVEEAGVATIRAWEHALSLGGRAAELEVGVENESPFTWSFL